MKTTFSLTGSYVTFTREDGDPRFHGTRSAEGEHALLHYLKQWLNARGFVLIKKRVQKDGHLMEDQFQPYLRSKNGMKERASVTAPHIYLVSGFYALRGANEDWNEGRVTLELHGDVFGAQPDWQERIKALGKRHRFAVR